MEAGESRRLLLNLRKGYFKHGDFFGTKIYLSQVHEVILDEVDVLQLERGSASSDEEGVPMSSQQARLARAVPRPSKIHRSDRLPEDAALPLPRPGPVRAALAMIQVAHQAIRSFARIFASDAAEPEDATDPQVYSVIVHAKATSGWKWVMGLTSRSHTVILDFRRPDERLRFISFVEALLPPSIAVSHARSRAKGSHCGVSSSVGTPAAVSVSNVAECGTMTPATATSAAIEAAAVGCALPPLELPPFRRAGPPTRAADHFPSAGAVMPPPGLSSRAARTETISIFVGTWNMGDAVTPASLEMWISKEEGHDIYAIATQECSDEHWMMALDSHLGSSFVRIAERRMGGIALVVFTHRRHATKVTGVETSFVPTGVLGVGTNKGAVALAFCIRGVRFCVVNAHLAAHQDKLLQRNKSVQEIAKHLRLGVTSLELPLQYHCIFCGDLNYRIDTPRAEVLRLVEDDQWHQLFEHDQLAQELVAERVLFGFTEAPIRFPPTYKYVRLAHAPNRRRPFGKMGMRARASFPVSKTPGKCGSASTEANRADGRVGASTAPSASTGRASRREPERKPSPSALSGFGFGDRRSSDDKSEPNVASPSMRTPIGSGMSGDAESSPSNGVTRKYDDEKNRVPSWCDRVLWRSIPGPISLSSTGSTDCDDPHFYASDHAPMHTAFEVELPVLPIDLPLHHCTIYLSNLTLYRARPSRHAKTGIADSSALGGSNLTARTAQGKGVPLPVAGAKLQNLPPQLSVYAHMLVLHKLMVEPPHHVATLNQDGRGATNIVIGPMLAQREFLALQQLQLRVVSASGGKLTELGQAVFSLDAAAQGQAYDFDVVVERLTVPAGFNLRGTVNVVFTKTLGEDHWMTSGRTEQRINAASRRPRQLTPANHNLVRGAGAGASASRLVRSNGNAGGRPGPRIVEETVLDDQAPGQEGPTAGMTDVEA